MVEMCEDLEGFDEKREEVQERSRRYRQKMTETCSRMTKEIVFVKGQLMLKATDHVKRGMARPSKFSPNGKDPL